MTIRYICSVLEEMRQANKFRNYSYLEGLIEEAQCLANKMESGLQNNKNALSSVENILRGKLNNASQIKEIEKVIKKYFDDRINYNAFE